MNKDSLNNIDIMSFLNSMQSLQKMSKTKKSKKSSRCTIKEEDNVYINECDKSDKSTKDEESIKNIE